MKSKRAYMAWQDNEIISSSNEEHTHMALIASHLSDDEENEVSNLEPSYGELHNAFLELHAECLRISRT